MRNSVLGRKQRADNARFAEVAANIETYVSRSEIELLAERTVALIGETIGQKKAAFAWSGGKDSIALEEICRRAGVTPCVMGLTRLEYPAFLQWVTDNMPDGLTVINTGQDLDFLRRRPEMLFPQRAHTAAQWFRLVQHTAQRRYFQNRALEILLLGRRRQDGNFVGRDGANAYESEGVLRYSPLSDWTHEDIIAFNHYNALPIPPIYSWANGYVQGTHPWAARQYTGSVEQGWREVYSIDPDVVRYAATKLESARQFLALNAQTS